MVELEELMSWVELPALGLALALLEGECELLVLERVAPVRGVADGLAPDVLLRIPAALALGDAFGAALTVADGDADALVDGVIDVVPLEGVIDAAGEALALVEAAAPVL